MPDAPPLTATDALRSLAEVARRDGALKSRTEGLTFVLWGMANAGMTLTYALGAPDADFSRWSEAPWWALAGGVSWFAFAVLASVGLWRSAALSFTTGITWRRGLGFFVGWLVLTPLLMLPLLPLTGLALAPVAKIAAIGALLVAFAATNPLGFTSTGRRVALALGLVALGASAWGLSAGLTGMPAALLVAATLGWAWIAGGLAALYRE